MTCKPERNSSPICEFLEAYNRQQTVRLHMPGHKGRMPDSYPAFLQQAAPFDLTEIAGADALYEAEGIIAQSEALTAQLYGSRYTCYSAGGSTLSILTMVSLAARRYGRRILAARGTHLAFVNACALTGAEPVWVYPAYRQEEGLCAMVTPEEIDTAMAGHPDIRLVYITSPDYYGRIADVKTIAEVVHRRGGILLCDSAHGSHLPFAPGVDHPIALGADLCCDSPHKTLPVFTGGSLFHTNLPLTPHEIKGEMSLYGSTSPSYLIMASLDACQCWLHKTGKAAFEALDHRVRAVKAALKAQGVTLMDTQDCTKITLDCQAMGYTHEQIGTALRQQGCEPEFCGGGKVVLMVSPQTPDADFERLIAALRLPRLPALPYPMLEMERPEQAVPVREAVLAPAEEVPVEQAVGRIAAATRISCPPGIPIVAAGEKIGDNQKNLLKNSGIFSLFVIK